MRGDLSGWWGGQSELNHRVSLLVKEKGVDVFSVGVVKRWKSFLVDNAVVYQVSFGRDHGPVLLSTFSLSFPSLLQLWGGTKKDLH
jgi:hypothetical protein